MIQNRHDHSFLMKWTNLLKNTRFLILQTEEGEFWGNKGNNSNTTHKKRVARNNENIQDQPIVNCEEEK